jgi:uncharacterized protein (DUF488 family)
MNDNNKTIWTIGHSTRTEIEFISLLKENKIQFLADIRRFAGSKRFPHFNKSNLNQACNNNDIDYIHFEKLGGRRPPLINSIHTEWKNSSFRGYADYMDTHEFIEEVEKLESISIKKNTAYMCSEVLWWNCHRALLSDHLKKHGWIVLHILGPGQVKEHPYTAPARQSTFFNM